MEVCFYIDIFILWINIVGDEKLFLCRYVYIIDKFRKGFERLFFMYIFIL